MSVAYPSWGAIEAALKQPVWVYNGARKIVTNTIWAPAKLPWIAPEELAQIGYSRPATKLKALKRMYFNEGEAERVRVLLAKRKGQAFTAVAMSTIAGAKDSRSMGHCINSIMLSIEPDKCEATILYRSTELIKKFTADLAFFPWVFEQIGVQPSKVTFFFSNAFISGVFFPSLMRFIEPITLLERLRRDEPALFRVATRFLRRSVRAKNQTFPFSPEQLQHEFLWEHLGATKIKSIQRYLEKHEDVR